MSEQHGNLELPDGRVVLRSLDLGNPSDMKGKMPRIEGEIQWLVIRTWGKCRMQVFAECVNALPIPASNVSDHIPSLQKEPEDGLTPEFRRIEHGEAGHVIPKDKAFFIRHPLTDKMFMQNAQDRFFRSFELILSSAEEKAIRAKSLFMPVTELDARLRSIFPPADFALVRHDGSYSA